MNVLHSIKSWWHSGDSDSESNNNNNYNKQNRPAANKVTNHSKQLGPGLGQGQEIQKYKSAKVAKNTYLVNEDRSCCTGPGIVPDVLPKNTLIEGFAGQIGPTKVNEKNKAEYDALLKLQADYNSKLSQYALSHKTLMNSTTRYITSVDNKVKKELNMRVTRGPALLEIPIKPQGCYLLGPSQDTTMDLQDDMGSNVDPGACTLRAADKGYTVFGLQGGTGKCYVGQDINKAISMGPAFSAETSTTLTPSTETTGPNDQTVMAVMLHDGQIMGIRRDIRFDLYKESKPVEGCSPFLGGNINLLSATYGGNCDKQHDLVPRSTISLTAQPSRCFNQPDGATTNGVVAAMAPCLVGAENQEMIYNATNKTIKYGNGGKCLDVYGGLQNDGAVINQWECNGGKNQEWSYKYDKTLAPGHAPTKCMTDTGRSLVLQDCKGLPSQQFTFNNADGSTVQPPPPPVKALGNTRWTNLPGALVQISHNYNELDKGVVCGVNQSKQLYCADEQIDNSGIKWIPIPGSFSYAHVRPDKKVVLLNNTGQVYQIDDFRKPEFIEVGRSNTSKKFGQIVYNNGLYCAIDNNKQVMCMDEGDDTFTWVPLDDPKKMSQIGMANDHLYGLDSEGQMWYLDDVMGSGSWQSLGGTAYFQQFGVDKKSMCGVIANKYSNRNAVYCADTNLTGVQSGKTPSPNWTVQGGALSTLSLNNGTLYGVNSGQQIYTGKVYNVAP